MFIDYIFVAKVCLSTVPVFRSQYWAFIKLLVLAPFTVKLPITDSQSLVILYLLGLLDPYYYDCNL